MFKRNFAQKWFWDPKPEPEPVEDADDEYDDEDDDDYGDSGVDIAIFF